MLPKPKGYQYKDGHVAINTAGKVFAFLKYKALLSSQCLMGIWGKGGFSGKLTATEGETRSLYVYGIRFYFKY